MEQEKTALRSYSPSFEKMFAKFCDPGHEKVEMMTQAEEDERNAVDAVTKCFEKGNIEGIRTKQKLKTRIEEQALEEQSRCTEARIDEKYNFGFFNKNSRKS